MSLLITFIAFCLTLLMWLADISLVVKALICLAAGAVMFILEEDMARNRLVDRICHVQMTFGLTSGVIFTLSWIVTSLADSLFA